MLYFENVIQGIIGSEWKLFLGLIFVLMVIFLPGGFMDLFNRIRRRLGFGDYSRRHNVPDAPVSLQDEREDVHPDVPEREA